MTKTLIPALAGLLLPTLSLQASIVGVDWGSPSTVTANQALVLPTPSDYSGTRLWNQTGSTALTPTGGVYTGVPYYGILQNSVGGIATDFASAQIMNRPAGARDRFYIQGGGSATTPAVLSGLVYVKKQDFMNGLGSAGPLSFDSDSSLTLTISNIAAGGSAVRVVRFAVLSGDQWYVSRGYQSSTLTWTIDDLSAQMWRAYRTEDDTLPLVDTPFAPADYTVSSESLDNIQAVGIYFYNSHSGSSTVRDFSFDEFRVSFAEPIPEPSSMALMGAAAVGVIFFGARRAQLRQRDGR